MASHAASRTAERVAGREIIVVQDTSELFLGGRRAEPTDMGLSAKAGERVACCCMRRSHSMPEMMRYWVLLMRRSGIGTRAR